MTNRADRPPQLPEVKTISKHFAEYLSPHVKKAGIDNLSRTIQSFIDKVHWAVDVLSIEEVPSMVQAFYQELQNMIHSHGNFTGLSEEKRETICDMTERYIMVCCYEVLFCPFSSKDEEKDFEIRARIRSLNWVTASHLECPFKETCPGVPDLIYTAINDILELDDSKAPQDKLASIVKCSKNIFTILHSANKRPCSADDFFPSLVYIVLKANPPRVFSNINFISRFANEQGLHSGEEGYYFTNLVAAVAFIDNLNAADLNLSQPEFDSYMSGEAIPLGSWEASLLMCQGIQTMGQNIKTISDMQEFQSKLISDVESLERDMAEFGENIQQEVDTVLARTQYTIHGPKRRVAVNRNDFPSPTTLPTPSIPDQGNLSQSLVSLLIQPLTIQSKPDLTGRMSTKETTMKPNQANCTNIIEMASKDDKANLDETPNKLNIPSPSMPKMKSSPVLSTEYASSLSSFSLIPLTVSSNTHPSLSSYIGLSALSFSIPSISCNTAASDLLPPKCQL